MHAKQQRRYLVLTALVLLFILIPTKTDVFVLNTLDAPQETTLKVYFGPIPVFSTTSSFVPLYLPKFWYRVNLQREGFHELNATLTPTLKSRNVSYTLQEIQFKPSWTFFDPTGTIQLDPLFKLEGIDARGSPVNTVVSARDNVTYGKYEVIVRDVDFEDTFSLNGTTLLKDDIALSEANLKPSERFALISGQEYAFVRNFVTAYVNLSARGFITELQGYPREYHLATKNLTLSFGDMTFLLCEGYAYQTPQETYFVPLKKKYTVVDAAWDARDCYRHALAGYTPQIIGSDVLSVLLGVNQAYYPYDTMVNEKEQKGNVVFTFDIESGRYVQKSNAGPHAINPCDDTVTQLGIEEQDKKDCANANRIAWFSPKRNEPPSTIPYPWSSGVRGLRTILDLSRLYGIKTTHFLLTKEFVVYDTYDSTLLEDLRELVQQNLTEAALHSKYHSRLDDANPEETLNEWLMQKALIEERFGVLVEGYRAPYLSILQRNQTLHEKMLRKAGIRYYSHGLDVPRSNFQIPTTLDYLANNNLWSVRQSAMNYGYALTLDHPWNIYYEEKEINDEWYLAYNSTRGDLAIATIFEAVSDGYVPVFAKEMKD